MHIGDLQKIEWVRQRVPWIPWIRLIQETLRYAFGTPQNIWVDLPKMSKIDYWFWSTYQGETGETGAKTHRQGRA